MNLLNKWLHAPHWLIKLIMFELSISFLYIVAYEAHPQTVHLNCVSLDFKRSVRTGKVMFLQLRNFLILGGVFQDERQPSSWANVRQFLTVLFAVISLGSYFVGGLVYSVKYQDVVNAVKTASYAYNNIFSVLLSYLYIVFNRNELKQLIDARNSAIINSWVVVNTYKFFQLIA